MKCGSSAVSRLLLVGKACYVEDAFNSLHSAEGESCPVTELSLMFMAVGTHTTYEGFISATRPFSKVPPYEDAICRCSKLYCYFISVCGFLFAVCLMLIDTSGLQLKFWYLMSQALTAQLI